MIEYSCEVSAIFKPHELPHGAGVKNFTSSQWDDMSLGDLLTGHRRLLPLCSCRMAGICKINQWCSLRL